MRLTLFEAYKCLAQTYIQIINEGLQELKENEQESNKEEKNNELQD